MMEYGDYYDEIEVQLGDSKEVRKFRKVSCFKQTGCIGTMEFYYKDFYPLKDTGDCGYAWFTCHAELYGRVVSKVRRCE